MNVCKCDRCGKYVDKSVIPEIRGYRDPTQFTPKSDIRMDLCPECYALLEDFLKGEYLETELTNEKGETVHD